MVLNADARGSWKKLLLPCLTKQEAPPTSKTDLSSKSKYLTGSKSAAYSSNSSVGDGLGTLEYNSYNKNKKSKLDIDLVETNSTTILEEDEESSSPDIMEAEEPKKKTYEELMSEKKEPNKDIFSRARIERRSTQRQKQHHLESVELDFFDSDDDDDDDDNEALF